MRQIFSVILAAALVFGGALLMAGYFAGIEVPERVPDEVTSGPHSMSGPIIPGELWHCPEVERILAGPLPGIFEVLPEELAEIDETFRWEVVHLDELIEETGSSAKGRSVSCVYEQTGRPWGWVKLNLASSLEAEIGRDPTVEGGWHKPLTEDCGRYGFSCFSSPRECGFYVREAEISTSESNSEDKEPCSPFGPPSIPTEQGGRATGGGD